MAFQNHIQAFSLTLLTIFFHFQDVSTASNSEKHLPLLMPNVQPLQNETYLCTAFKMPRNDFEYIVEFHPNASMETAHHVLIYGCGWPGKRQRDTPRYVWDCGEMNRFSTGYSSGPVCERGSQIIYAWAMEAPALKLPEGVGFKVGKGSGINYLVLQVHYANVNHFLNGATDNSGIILTLLPSNSKRVSKNAGVYLLGSGGIIPAHEKVAMETACVIDEPVEIHPFAFRTHTHKLGKVVSGYKIDQEGNWELIGKHNPQDPQMFYPVENKNLVIRTDDIVAARCTMGNFRDRDTSIGATANDEMCNFYMMYYVEGDNTLKKKYCFSAGPPSYYWTWDTNIGYVPPNIDRDASELN